MTCPVRALVAFLLAAALAPAGCASFEGARRYTAGTRALDRGDAALAVRELERAAALVPHASEVQNHLGLAYAALGRRADALRAFARAVQLDCDDPAARANLDAAIAARAGVAAPDPAP